MKHICGLRCFCAAAALLLLTAMPTAAATNSRSTSHTITMSTEGKLQIAQDAYLPTALYLDLGMNKAGDLDIMGRNIYVADTGNARCLVVDIETGDIQIIGEGILKAPQGIAAGTDGRIYVADSGTRKAYRFDAEGNVEQEFSKPEGTPAFGRNAEFKPVKVAPAEEGGVYLVNEGSVAGIVHMNGRGRFINYFGSGSISMSPFEKFLRLILNEEQQKKFISKTPPSFANIVRGSDGLIYSAVRGKSVKVVKHNTAGSNLLDESVVPEMDDVRDLAVSNDGRMFAVTMEGYVYEISRDGNFLCYFAGPYNGNERNGLFYMPSGIALDDQDNVYVLDQERNLIQVFEPTANQRQIHTAVRLYNEGQYDQSMSLLGEVLKTNSTSAFAHIYLGRNYMQKGDYTHAIEHFAEAGHREQYSDAFWEIRNAWLQQNLLWIMVMTIVLSFGILALKRALKKRRRKVPALPTSATGLRQHVSSNRLLRDLGAVRYAARHPMDSVYEIRIGRTGSILSATILYAAFFVLLVLYQIARGMIFSVRIQDFSLGMNLIAYVAVICLFVVSNYFISCIKDGNGTLRLLYITLAYSLSPLLMIMPVVILVSNVATLGEAILINLLMLAALTWSVCCEVISLMEIHQYSFERTLYNIVMTALIMLMFVLVLSLCYLLIQQVISLFRELYVEVVLRG